MTGKSSYHITKEKMKKKIERNNKTKIFKEVRRRTEC